MRTILALLFLAGISILTAADHPAFRAGAATSVITPPLGTPIVGGLHPFPAQHIHDDLHARCLYLDNGDSQVAIVVCDLLGAHQMVFDEARRLVVAETNLPGAHLFIACTHTHSAGTALGLDRFAVHPELDDYQRFVARRIADAVRCARNNLAPAQIGWTTASEPREVFNRRWFMKPGTVIPPNPFGEKTDAVRMNPPAASPTLDRPAGPTDPEISILAVRSPAGRPIAVLSSYSLHYVGGVRGADISADYYGVFCDRLGALLSAEHLDPPFVGLMANGTSGNINNVDFSKPVVKRAPYEKMREVADRIAQDVAQAHQSIEWKDWVPLDGRLDTLEIGHRHPTAEQLARAKSLLDAAHQAEKLEPALTVDEIYAGRITQLNEWPATIPLPLQALRIGDLSIGGAPVEVFAETGLAFKQRASTHPSFIIELNNGYYGYLPTPEHHALGGYETWLGMNRLESEASTKILDHLLKMVTEMR